MSKPNDATSRIPARAGSSLWLWPALGAWLPLIATDAWKDWLWWAAVFAPCAGAWVTCIPQRWGRALGLGSWCLAWLYLGRDLPLSPRVAGLGALLGLMSLGGFLGILGAGSKAQPLTGAWIALALPVFLIGLPAGFWLFTDPPWPPAVAARMLDLSPAALMMESAGVDFLRLSAIYGPVGADSMDPNLRLAWGNLAGWGGCVLGLCLAMVVCTWRARKMDPKRNS
ncbi:MAG: hypothetical protein P1V35_14010 [Planctomycetota bacterium]|nr:hypothetical protein [Planctomycetota bacterium]